MKREIPTNTSSRDHVTSMFTRVAVNVNCDHSWSTSSKDPPNHNTSTSDDTLARSGNVASGAPESATFKSSAKRYSRSRITRRPRRMDCLRRSSSLSLRGFPSKSTTRKPGVSSLSHWSRAKRLTPWMCFKTSCGSCVRTETSLWQMRQKKWLGLPAASVAPVTKN